MLGLKLPSDPRWADIASKSIEDILVDHAFCEQKAASSGISLIVQFSEKQELVEKLTEIVAEEWAHFERVLNELKKRGFQLGPRRNDEYVIQLKQRERKGGSPNAQLVEKLLIFAMIEARSCERFKLLSEQVSDPELRKFYYEFMVSEAGHYRTFLDLAKQFMPEDVVKKRWKEIVIEESDIIKNLEIRADRIH